MRRNFKDITERKKHENRIKNDTYGHHVGDEVLKSIAIRLQKAVRPNDTVARMGGDEFTILLTERKKVWLTA